MKYLLLAVALWLIWRVLRGRRAIKRERQSPWRAARKAPVAGLVACAHCGVHVPEPEAIRDGNGLPYCSDSHRRLGVSARKEQKNS